MDPVREGRQLKILTLKKGWNHSSHVLGKRLDNCKIKCIFCGSNNQLTSSLAETGVYSCYRIHVVIENNFNEKYFLSCRVLHHWRVTWRAWPVYLKLICQTISKRSSKYYVLGK